MKKFLGALIVCVVFSMTGCSSCSRELKTFGADFAGGLDRIVTVYDMNLNPKYTYEGKIDIQDSEGGKVLFDMNGKRIIWYNTPISVIEK